MAASRETAAGRGGEREVKAEEAELIPRAAGEDVIVPVRMRRSSFEKLASTRHGRSVPVSEGMIGLVLDRPQEGWPDVYNVYTFVIWSSDEFGLGVPEQIPGNQAAAALVSRDPSPQPESSSS